MINNIRINRYLVIFIPLNEQIDSVYTDGAYDTKRCRQVIADRQAHAVIPPRKNAKPWKDWFYPQCQQTFDNAQATPEPVHLNFETSSSSFTSQIISASKIISFGAMLNKSLSTSAPEARPCSSN